MSTLHRGGSLAARFQQSAIGRHLLLSARLFATQHARRFFGRTVAIRDRPRCYMLRVTRLNAQS